MAAALVSVMTLERGLQQWKFQASSAAQMLAFYQAEAGLAEGFDDLRIGGSGNVGTREIPALFGSGAFWVESVEDSYGVVHMTSTGLFEQTAYRLEQAVEKPRLPLASYGFFGVGGVVVGENVTIQPRPGAPEPPGEGGEPPAPPPGGERILLPVAPPPAQLLKRLLGSDGPIEVLAGAVVDGDVIPGVDEIVDLVVGAVVNGSVLPELNMRPLPEIAMPVLESVTNVTLAASQLSTLASGTHALGQVVLNTRSVLTVQGPASAYVSSLILKGGGTLSFDTSGGPVHVYVRDHIGLRTGSRVLNSSGNAADVVFMVDASVAADRDGDGDLEAPVEWFTLAPITAAIYAPRADVTLPAGTTFQGGIVALMLQIGDDSVLTFDERIEEVTVRARDYRVLSWRVMNIPSDEDVLIRKDLVKSAVERGDTPTSAAQSRIPATNTYSFTTPGGETLKYRGSLLGDLTTAVVSAVVPTVVDAVRVPEFPKYSSDTGDDRSSAEALFDRAFAALCGYVGGEWTSALKSGEIPGASYRAVVADGILIEPFRTGLRDAALRADLSGYLAASWLPAGTKNFLAAAMSLSP